MNNSEHRKLQPPRQISINWIENLSHLLDEQFRIPGTRFRFGIEPLINLIPFVGNIGTFILSASLMLTIAQKGVSNKVLVKMALNVLIDAIISAIPFFGQIFDFYFKANKRNVQLLKEHYSEGKHQGSGRTILIVVAIVLLLLMVAVFYAFWKLGEWLLSYV